MCKYIYICSSNSALIMAIKEKLTKFSKFPYLFMGLVD